MVALSVSSAPVVECMPVKCDKCGKTTWKGCGRHVDAVSAALALGKIACSLTACYGCLLARSSLALLLALILTLILLNRSWVPFPRRTGAHAHAKLLFQRDQDWHSLHHAHKPFFPSGSRPEHTSRCS
ncbi:hypothetical protein IE81DRAFT_179162 [Ceraceosorus guamensis]|uniref:Uncharacterized protein n=1 Tax=Ceraceosorus guamensis TaxID=1522189 RepID=A0A316VWP8_9BASI|nr:hypothetical protein IE81DRAFT_179162 [Ceraceosorus guamensis]PWN41378.1 hypothetical protein IE81DRAFT_179162 [Ceraceosorus guamensis]